MAKKVTITYQTWEAKSPKVKVLSQKSYFDPLRPGDKSYEQDGIAKHTEPHIYLRISPNKLKFLHLKVPDAKGYNVFNYQYLNGAASTMIFAKWQDKTEEIIHSMVYPDGSYHIIRTVKVANGKWSTVTNARYAANDMPEKIKFIKGWRHDDLLAYGAEGGV